MSFNLDELTALRFQELCNVLLQNFFSQLITPMVRSGRDSGFDGKLEMLPINYSDLLNRPFEYKSPDGKDSLWVFQCKFTQVGGEDAREKAVVAALKKEIELWKTREKKSTHYIFFTNVNLRPSALEEIETIGRGAFPYFEVWHEPKISGFIANNISLQKTFFPNRATSLDIVMIDIKALANVPVREENTAALTSSAESKEKLDEPKEAIRQLAEYEIGFLQTNTSFLEKLRVTNDKKDVPDTWKKHTHKSKCDGLLGLATDTKSLQWVIEKITLNEVHITVWQRFLGEKTVQGEELINLAYNPDLEKDLLKHLDQIFECVQGENAAHVKVDQYLRRLEAKILSDMKTNNIQDAQEGLRELLRARRDYSTFKKEHPSAFYPNMRRWGRKPIFGWDFMDLWESVLKDVCDVAFSGQYPKSVYELLIYLPFGLCIDAIQAKRPKESFQAELWTLGTIFWVLVEKNDKSFTDSFLDKLEDLAQEVNDLDLQLKTVSDAEWALSIAKEVASYIANLGYLALSGKAPMPFDKLNYLLELSTSLHFMEILAGSAGSALGSAKPRRRPMRRWCGLRFRW